MAQITTATLRKQIESGRTGPLYMLTGADEAEKSAVATEFLDIVDEGLRAFNVERFFGGEAKVDDVIDAANTLPMMVARRVLIVHQAERLLIPKRESKAAEQDQEQLEAFLQAPPPHATVVFVCGPLDLRRRTVKLLLKEAQIVDCGTIADRADAEQWLKARAARDGATLEPAAARALVDRAGADLVRLRAGFERVVLYAMGQAVITAEDVRQAVAAGPEAHANFGIANAIERNDVRVALKELGLALDAGAVPFFVLGQLRFAAEKLPGPRLKDAVEALLRTDLALKSSGGDPRVLLERLVVELCEVPRRRVSGPPRGGPHVRTT